MKGCRSLSESEVEAVFQVLGNTRDRLLFIMGVKTGLRISELLSLRVQDVWVAGNPGSEVRLAKCNTKGKREGRQVPLTAQVKQALVEHLRTSADLRQPLFKSTKGQAAITRMQAHRVLKAAFQRLNLEGNLATHAMRKTFAKGVHEALGHRIEKTQIAMGHRSLGSTASYIQVDREEVVAAILGLG